MKIFTIYRRLQGFPECDQIPKDRESICRRRSCSIYFLGITIFGYLIAIWISLRSTPTPCPKVQSLPPLPHHNCPSYAPAQPPTPSAMDGQTDGAFNINLDLGHWDRQRLYKTFHFVSTGTNFSRLSHHYAVTLATQSSIEKLNSLVHVAHQWTGPISVALFVSGEDDYYLLFVYVTFLQACFPSIREQVSFHLTVPKANTHDPHMPAYLEVLHESKKDCNKPDGFLQRIIKQRENARGLPRYPPKVAYPQNHMRNTARKTCQTHYVFLTDVDIVPSYGLAEDLDTFLKSPKSGCSGKCAYVIPTYELEMRTAFPKSKTDLIRLAKKGLARPFHQKVFIYNQYATNFSRWEAEDGKRQDSVVISHNVTNFEFLYEPFYVAEDTVPEHDERFIGYGYTRNTQVYEMYVAGYKFVVLSPIFTIHWGLQVKKGRPSWRERQNSQNRKHFNDFKRQVYTRYNKDPLHLVHHK